MPAKATYLVRGPNGRMATIVAHSNRGALKLWMAANRTEPGGLVSVKERGSGDWIDYKVH